MKGTQGARKRPHFSDTHVGGPYRCGEGAPLYSQERGFIVNYAKLIMVTEQQKGPLRAPNVSVKSIRYHEDQKLDKVGPTKNVL